MAQIVLASERPDLQERAHEATAGIWPEYNLHGEVPNRYWERLDDVFPEFQFVLWDEESDEVLGQGHSIPLAWDGTPEGLPDGFDGLLSGAFALHEAGGTPTMLSALAIEVAPAHQGRGTSRRMIEAMVDLARSHGFPGALAPLRPTWKERYPLVPIERYAAWTREDGLPFDPWMRTHVRLGGLVLRPEPRSLAISGSVAEWEEWTGMAFPESGDYVFPRGLATVAIDREADVGRYWEPNVWMLHPAGAGAGT
jgi:GNAT superfamily N-acetyltransferase